MSPTVTEDDSYSTVKVFPFDSPSTLLIPSTRPTAMRIVITQPSQVIPGTFSFTLSIMIPLLIFVWSSNQFVERIRRSNSPGLKPEKMRAPPTAIINTVETPWMRRPQTRRATVTAGPNDDPKNASRNISNPMVTAKIENASSPVRNPPTPVAKAATAARKGAVQPTPTATNPAPNR